MTDDSDISARLDRIETKLDEVLEYVRMVQSPEYQDKQYSIELLINMIANKLAMMDNRQTGQTNNEN